jgi:ArsR family transcriptional regulator
MIQTEIILRALADGTRLRVINLLLVEDELCVCELTEALQMVQPKVSRHLAILREAGLVLDRREGLWIHYRIHPDLPAWGNQLLEAMHKGCTGKPPYSDDLKRLSRRNIGANVSCS